MVRIQNDGASADRFTFSHTGSSSRFTVTSPFSSRAGTSPLLQPGQSWTFTVRVHHSTAAVAGDEILVRTIIHSKGETALRDGATLQVRATAS